MRKVCSYGDELCSSIYVGANRKRGSERQNEGETGSRAKAEEERKMNEGPEAVKQLETVREEMGEEAERGQADRDLERG